MITSHTTGWAVLITPVDAMGSRFFAGRFMDHGIYNSIVPSALSGYTIAVYNTRTQARVLAQQIRPYVRGGHWRLYKSIAVIKVGVIIKPCIKRK